MHQLISALRDVGFLSHWRICSHTFVGEAKDKSPDLAANVILLHSSHSSRYPARSGNLIALLYILPFSFLESYKWLADVWTLNEQGPTEPVGRRRGSNLWERLWSQTSALTVKTLTINRPSRANLLGRKRLRLCSFPACSRQQFCFIVFIYQYSWQFREVSTSTFRNNNEGAEGTCWLVLGRVLSARFWQYRLYAAARQAKSDLVGSFRFTLNGGWGGGKISRQFTF